MIGLSDRDVAGALARGDREVFAGICACTGPKIARMGVRLVGPDAAEDLAQDVLVRVWERRAQFDPARGAFMGWVWGIARNAATDHLRAASGEVRARTGLTALTPPADPSPLEARLLAAESARELRRSLAALDSAQRVTIWRSFWLEQSHAEIARRTGEPLGTVKGRIRRGIARMAADMPGAAASS